MTVLHDCKSKEIDLTAQGRQNFTQALDKYKLAANHSEFFFRRTFEGEGLKEVKNRSKGHEVVGKPAYRLRNEFANAS